MGWIVAADRLAGAAVDPGLLLIVLAARDGPRSETERCCRGAMRVAGRARCSERCTRPITSPAALDGAPMPIGELDDATSAARTGGSAPHPEENLASPHGMAAISARLRAPDGCPWTGARITAASGRTS